MLRPMQSNPDSKYILRTKVNLQNINHNIQNQTADFMPKF